MKIIIIEQAITLKYKEAHAFSFVSNAEMLTTKHLRLYSGLEAGEAI